MKLRGHAAGGFFGYICAVVGSGCCVEFTQSPPPSLLQFSFQTPDKIYLVLDYINGGELFFHLQNEGIFSYVYCGILT